MKVALITLAVWACVECYSGLKTAEALHTINHNHQVEMEKALSA